MAKVTDEDLFRAAHQVLETKGFEKARLADVARELAITPAALYKHFDNKDDLFNTVNEHWLTAVDKPAMDMVKRVTPAEREQALHDWLRELAVNRRSAYERDPAMMQFFEHRLKADTQLITDRMVNFGESVETIMAWNTFRSQRGLTIMQALTFYYHPFFAGKWDDALFSASFEATWLELLPIIRQDIGLVETPEETN